MEFKIYKPSDVDGALEKIIKQSDIDEFLSEMNNFKSELDSASNILTTSPGLSETAFYIDDEPIFYNLASGINNKIITANENIETIKKKVKSAVENVRRDELIDLKNTLDIVINERKASANALLTSINELSNSTNYYDKTVLGYQKEGYNGMVAIVKEFEKKRGIVLDNISIF